MPIIKPRGRIKEIIGKEELIMNAETLEEIFNQLSKIYQLASEPAYVVIVNGQRVVPSIGNYRVRLKKNDLVEIIPPVGGG